jgi:hypothetical protein
MKATTPMLVLCALTGCDSHDTTDDLALRDMSMMSHCLSSTPQTVLRMGACALAPANGYCYVDMPQPTF